MKRNIFTLIVFTVFSLILKTGFAQTTNDVLNLLIENKVIDQAKADSLRADYGIKQQSSLNDKKLKIDFESRTRGEYRNGYQQLSNDTSKAAYFVNQRSRLNINYVQEDKLALQFSIQDLRVWGQQDPKYTTPSTLQIFEAWAEPYITPELSVRIGRQKLSYDNQRLFAESNWRLGGVAHDAVNIRYNTDNLNVELAGSFNQTAEQVVTTSYKPTAFSNYKFLAVNYIRYKVIPQITLTALNSADGFQDPKYSEIYRVRYTNGGRIEYELGNIYATVSGYYQAGKIVRSSKTVKVDGWYIQPEIKYGLFTGTVFRLGAEVFSGNKPTNTGIDHSFQPLYGSGHAFNGSLDLITKFDSDLGKTNPGLVNPYFFVIQTINDQLEVRADFHTFYLKENVLNSKKANINKYLGFENDWLVSYKPDKAIKVDLGFSIAKVTQSLQIVKSAKAGAEKYNPTWAYVSVTIKPTLLSSSFK